MSNRPAPMITKPAARNRPAANNTAAAMLMSRPRNVRTFGWIFESARPRTMRRMILSQAMPIARVNVIFTVPSDSTRIRISPGCQQMLSTSVVNQCCQPVLSTSSVLACVSGFLNDFMDGGQPHNLKRPGAPRDLKFHIVAHFLAEQCFADGRRRRYTAIGHVGLLAGDQ